MKVKQLKTKVSIDMSVSEYDTLFKYINKIDSMLNTLHETNDLWLSDVHNLSSLRYELVELLDAEWDSNTYRYVKRGSWVREDCKLTPMTKEEYRVWEDYVINYNYNNPNDQISYEVTFVNNDIYEVKLLDLKVDREGE